MRQTYTTPGIHIKTTAFALHDQIRESNPELGGGFEEFAKRLGSRQAQFIMKNLDFTWRRDFRVAIAVAKDSGRARGTRL
jgi:hypothetical protein